ncbi:TolC family protein [Granulicella sibirica]|uniref:Cobalt-zinc-cadmium resistance protein CzcA n=1 Tax=Granulicella sibirica TaxID=2479048 RepID=A0A4Q0T826_9BACT|nr:TolC family protein [Granulicella sibirica]RXH58288.1 Cobalt-zinc-cadmium resistance protein CzcA [Granulicella sibirica]
MRPQSTNPTRFGKAALLALLTLTPHAAILAQAGGGAGSGTGAGAAGGSAAGSPGASGAASRGAAADRSGSDQGTPAQTSGSQSNGTAQSPAAAYAAGASLGPDPRKPPVSRPGAFTLQQIIAMAQDHNPTLLAAQANLRAVRAQEVQAAVRANPYLTIYGTDVTLPAEGSANPYSYSAQVSRLFERGEKRRWRIDAAKATTGQTQAQLEDTVRQTVLTIKQAFTKMLVAKEALELANASLKDYRHEVEISLDRYKAGDLGKLDYERLDLQLGSFESDAANNEITVLQASDQLQTLIGVETPVEDFDIAGDIVPPIVSGTRAALIQQALAKRPDLAAAQAAVGAAEANARLAVANGTTDPTLEGEYDRAGTDNSAGFSVNIPLRLFDRNHGNKQTARYQADASRLSQTAARNQVLSDVDQAWVGYTRAKALSDRFSKHYLDESKDILSIAQFSFEHGGLALIDYLDALRDARSSTSDALNAFATTWNAIHQLSAATATNVAP